MFTKARIAGHPVHPMLVSFPIALYTATVVAVIVHAATGDPFWYRAAMWTNLGGIVMAVVAAVPGLVDLVFLPQYTRAKSTALRHASFNVVSLILFTCCAAVLYRNVSHNMMLDDGTPLVLGIIGLASTMAAGWLGWTLVQKHHVGVRPTEYLHANEELDEIDDLDELPTPPPMYPSKPRHIPIRH